MTRTKIITLIVSVGAAILITAIAGDAQMKMVTIGGGDVDGTCMIAELGALIFENDSTLSVEHIMESNQRPKAYREVDLQTGDVILMLNGKRIRTADDFTAAIDAMSAGDKVQLGVRRDKSMQIVSFDKGAPEDLPQIKMVTKTLDDGEREEHGGGQHVKMTHTGGPDDLIMLGGSGLIAREDSAGVVILLALPKAKELLDDVNVEGGDRVVKLQGKEFNDLKTLREAFDAIEMGASVDLVLSRDGEEFSVSFKKAEAENIMMKRQ